MKIGDKVKILEPSERPDEDSDTLWTYEMLNLVGATGTILDMLTDRPGEERDEVKVEIDSEEDIGYDFYWFYPEDLEVIQELPILEYTPSSTKSSLAKKLFYDSSTLMAFEDEEAAREYYFAKVEKEFSYWFKNLSIIQVYFKED